MGIVFGEGFECGTGVPDDMKNTKIPPNRIVFRGWQQPTIDGIYDYEVRGDLLELTRTYEGVSETRMLAPGDSAWGITWDNDCDKEKPE